MPYKDKELGRIKAKEWREANKEKLKEQYTLYNNTHKEYRKKYNEENKEIILVKRKIYRENNAEKIKEQKKNDYLKHKEHNNKKSRGYYWNNRDRLIKQKTEYISSKCFTDEVFRMKRRISARFRLALNLYTENGKTKALKDYGIDIPAIVESLGQPPQDGKKYHIDHIIPIKAFDLNNLEHIKLCWHKDNLQWLEASENVKKNDKYNQEDFDRYLKEHMEAISE